MPARTKACVDLRANGEPKHSRAIKKRKAGGAGRPGSPSASDSSTEEDLLVALQGISLQSAEDDKYRGIDIPKGASMTVKHIGPNPADYTVRFLSPGTLIPNFELPVKKTSYKKTVAVLQRADSDVLVAAVSGWSEIFSDKYEYLLDNFIYTDEVFDVSDSIGHGLQPDWRDNSRGIRRRAGKEEPEVPGRCASIC